MSRGRIGPVVHAWAVVTVVAGSAVVPVAVPAQADDSPRVTTRAATTTDRVVTLPTGERVFLAAGGRAVRTVESPTGTTTDPGRVRTMAVGDHLYVVPAPALPFIGRQLA